MRTGPFACGLAVVALAAALAGCATPTIGTAFVRPPPDFVRLGETTRAQVVARYGKPEEETQVRNNGQLMYMVTYVYGSREEAARVPGTVCVRLLTFAYFEDKVVSDRFSSNCESDHTDFDESKVAAIVKGKSRCDDVIAALGRPHSSSIHPAVANKGDLGIGYVFEAIGAGPSYSPTVTYRYSKQFECICGPDGGVHDMAFVESGRR